MRKLFVLMAAVSLSACAAVLGLQQGEPESTDAGGAGGAGEAGGPSSGGGGVGEGGGGAPVCDPPWGRNYAFTAIAGDNAQVTWDVAVDAAGNTLVVGDFAATVDMGMSTYTATGTDGFVAAVSSTGDVLWARPCGGVGLQTARAVVSTPSIAGVNGVAGGEFLTTAEIDDLTFDADNQGDEELWMHAFDGDGNGVWTHSYPSTGADVEFVHLLDMAAMPSGELIASLSYRFDQTLEDPVGNNMVTLNAITGEDGALIRIDGATGALHEGALTFGGTGEDAVPLLSEGLPDSDESALLAVGEYTVSFDLGLGPPLDTSGTKDAVVFGTTDDLNPTWYVDVKSAAPVEPGAVVGDAEGRVHATFSVTEDVEVGEDRYVVSTPSVLYVRLLPPADPTEIQGTVEHALVLSASSQLNTSVKARGLAVDACGQAFLAGDVLGATDFACGQATGGTDVFFGSIVDGMLTDCERFGNNDDQRVVKAAHFEDVFHVVGAFEGSLNFGTPLPSAGGEDGFVVRAAFEE